MARLKVTGYIDLAEIDADYVDESHTTGLTSEGYDVLIVGDQGSALALSLSDLDDLNTEVVEY